MNKNFTKLITALMFAVVGHGAAMASSIEVIDGLKFLLVTETGEATLMANDYSGDVVIPSTVNFDGNTYSVVALEDECFKNCKNLTSVDIPSSIKAIGVNCFYRCYSLTSVKIPSSVTSLGNRCFEECI